MPAFNYNEMFSHYATSIGVAEIRIRAPSLGLSLRDSFSNGLFNVPAALTSYLVAVLDATRDAATAATEVPGSDELLKLEAVTMSLKNGWCELA